LARFLHGSFPDHFQHLPPRSAKPRQHMVVEFPLAISFALGRLARVMTELHPAEGWYLNCYLDFIDNLVRERHTREQAAKYFTLAGFWWKVPMIATINWSSAECFFPIRVHRVIVSVSS